MMTLAVFFTFLLLSIHAQAVYFPVGSHNRGPVVPATGGTITMDPPTRIVRRQTTASSTLQPVIAVQNTTDWSSQTNQRCQAAVNTSTITNPAGVYPCYNVISYDPNTGIFLAEVRMLQVVNMMQSSVLSSVTGSSMLFEFPDATVTNNIGTDSFVSTLGKREIKLVRRQTSTQGQVNIVDSFLLNGTTDISKK
jgi:hypothetical protein